jgi:DNA-binding transcriptional MerR regulator
MPAAAREVESRLLRINEVAAETGLTSRAIRYYEEIGLLAPAARSDGDYRLSLAQIGQLLEDDAARERNRERYRQTGDPDERRALVVESRARTEHQIEILETKAARLATMIEEARARARHLDAHLAELDGGPPPHPERVSAPSEPKPRSRS